MWYRRQPELIEAVRFTGGQKSAEQVLRFIWERDPRADTSMRRDPQSAQVLCVDVEQPGQPVERALPGYWMVRINTRFVVYSDDEFKATFEAQPYLGGDVQRVA